MNAPQQKPALTELDVQRAIRLLGFALFNLAKGKTTATQTLVEKAREALGAPPWDRDG
jgi:hypothetical protein